ncbi:MAG: hypothetical protein J6L72_02805 [Butyricicoccus sp.]|nr:hypothetical protein [Butyricicoccus sp.]
MENPYDDIMQMPHPTSSKHSRMSMRNRAAQFAPFSALTGYQEAVKETARLTDTRVELDEGAKAALDERLRMAQEHLGESHELTFTYFVPDPKKPGGACVTVSGVVKKLNTYERTVVLQNGIGIPIDDILDINGKLFQTFED